jgi:hypothetical protein
LQTNFLIIHGCCTALALNVPCPYFVQEILLGAAFQTGHQHQNAAVTRLLISAEVSERDKSFVRMVSGPEATEWWNQEDADRYPVYSEVISFIHQRVYQVRSPFFSLLEIVINLFKFWKDDQLQRLPVSYIDRIEHLLNLWYASALSDDEPGEEAGLSRGTENTAATGALDSGDVEMATDPTEQSNTDDKSDPLMGLALHLNLISSENPLLSAEDRQDLALLDRLTQAHTQVEQVLGLETEMAATEQWNFEAVVQLIDLATNLADIPFTGKTQVHDQDPSSVASVSAPTGLASKGKGRLEEGPKKTSLTELLFQSVGREGSAGSNGERRFPVAFNLLTSRKSIRYLRCPSAPRSKMLTAVSRISFLSSSVPTPTTIANIVKNCSTLSLLICSGLPLRRSQVCLLLSFCSAFL